MFASRPRKTVAPQDESSQSLKSLSVVRCEPSGTGNNEFLVYQILGPPELFQDSSGDDLAANGRSTDNIEFLDEFNIRQRKPKTRSNETAPVSDVEQTSVRSDTRPGIVATYGRPSCDINDDIPCDASSRMDLDEAQSQSTDQDEDTNAQAGEQTDVDDSETPVRVRRPRVRDMSGRSRTPGWHICPQCSYTTKKRSILEKHLDVHRDKPRIKCNKCELNFPNESALKKHQLSHNTPYRCSQCGDGFSNYLKLESHFMKEHTQVALYNCKECHYSCSRVENMRRHVRCHTGERPYQCPHCTYAGADAFKLKRHILTHFGEKPYRCDQCDASFTQVNDLKVHKYKHSSTKSHACDKCGSDYITAARLRAHVRSMHTAREPILCRVCNVTLPDKHSYRLHNQSHSVQHKCDKCLRPFNRRSDLKRHQLTVHRELHSVPQEINSSDLYLWVCSKCNIGLINEDEYRLHLKCHKKVTRAPHKCKNCGRSFASSPGLKKHQHSAHRPPQQINSRNLETLSSCANVTSIRNEHNRRLGQEPSEADDRRPHKCNKCTSSFARPSDLRRHEFLLHRPRKIHCKKCQKILPDKHSFYLHIQEHKKAP